MGSSEVAHAAERHATAEAEALKAQGDAEQVKFLSMRSMFPKNWFLNEVYPVRGSASVLNATLADAPLPKPSSATGSHLQAEMPIHTDSCLLY